MLRIAVVNGKGGVGKSTVSVLLANAIAMTETFTVGLIDTDDEQGTSTEWLESDEFTLVKLLGKSDSTEGYDVVVYDTQPLASSETLHDVLGIADIILLVSSPSPTDLKTTLATTFVISEKKKKHSIVRIVYNQVVTNSILSRQLLSNTEKIGVPALKTLIPVRQNFQHVNTLGCSSLDEEAKSIFLELAIEVMELSKIRE